MKKKLFTLLLALVVIATTAQAQVVLNETNFPDANFRAVLAKEFGISEGDEITAEKIASTTILYVSYKGISDLKGIEYFTALTSLNCNGNYLITLNVSNNVALTSLSCGYNNNRLSSLDVSGCSALTYLNCENNQLSSLDLSGCTALTQLYCSGNRIRGEGMDVLVKSLPTVDEGSVCMLDYEDENICTKSQVAVARAKGWNVLYHNPHSYLWEPYNGHPNINAVILNAVNFPDANFRAALNKILGISEGDEITESIIAATTSLDVSYKKITDLTGIEHFTALTTLWCDDNQLTTLDVSKNTALKSLSCDSNQLTSLDVSKNTALKGLDCSLNQLTALDVSQNTALMTLNCYNNQLTALDLSYNTALMSLNCYNNQLTALDLSKNTSLTNLRCFNNQIKGEAMDTLVASLRTVVSGDFFVINTKNANEGNICTKAQVAIAKEKGWTVYDYNESYSNRQEYEGSDDAAAKLLLNAANFPDANFRAALAKILGISEGDEITEAKIAATTSLDVSKSRNTPAEEKIADLTGIEHFTALTRLDCNYNQLTALDVSKNTALTSLLCQYNQLTALEVSNNTALTVLRCYGNQLTALDMSNNTALTELRCDGNQLTALDVSNNTALTELWCYTNQLTSLDVSGCTALKYLYCYYNQLTALDVSNNIALNYLYCDNNQLTSLDVSKNTALTSLYCSNNQLTSLDVSKNAALEWLHCYNNQLTALDVSKNTALIRLYCSDNQLTALDVSKNTALKYLYCSDNQLTALDVSKNTALTDLYCYNNQLTSLDVSKNTALTELYCYNNQLTSLDVSKNTKLTWLRCYGNQLTSLDVSKNTALTHLWCFSNQIKGEAMDALVASLPAVEWGEFIVINTNDENEGNVCTKSQVAVAKGKGWKVYDYNGGVYDENYEYPEYEGSDPVEEDIDPVDEDDNIDFGSDMDEDDDLNGNVIGDIFYNIGDGNGEYNAEEGCIVLKKTTDDETVDGLSGKDIFGEDFKGQFTGIVFKVPSGKGTVKVTAETTGNMLLKVKIGDGEPVEMELNGKLKISFPYNVSETTYVYIYAGAANEAKGFGTTNATEDAALKIYGIEFERGETTGVGASLNDNGQRINDSWYTIDGVKLNGEPTKKGIYIYNGKKVKK